MSYLSNVISGLEKILFKFNIFTIGEVRAGADNGGGLQNPLPYDSLPLFLQAILEEIVIPIGFIIVVLSLIYSGFLYVKAQGNSDQISRAHQAFLWTAVGAVVLLGAWAISQVICNTLDRIVDTDLQCEPRE